MATETSVSATSEAATLSRLIRPDNGDLRTEAVEALLAIPSTSARLSTEMQIRPTASREPDLSSAILTPTIAAAS
jgi:hypothetical protein